MSRQVAEVVLWGDRIGAVAWDADAGFASFEYDPTFVRLGVEPAPLTMPLGRAIYRFPELAPDGPATPRSPGSASRGPQ